MRVAIRNTWHLLLLVAGSAAAEPPPHEPLEGRELTLVVQKADRRLEVRAGDEVLRRYPIGLGFAPVGDKEREGDGKTPEGTFKVVRRVPGSAYYKAFLIDYPGVEDAERGLKDGTVDAATAKRIREAHASGGVPPQTTGLGGYIEIHGMGARSDWTLGCVALENSAIDELWPHVRVGTPVIIEAGLEIDP
jgi:murein L,D-transpeptidase YafK